MELAKVVEVVYVVAVALIGGSLTADCSCQGAIEHTGDAVQRDSSPWRNPDVIDSPLLEVGNMFFESNPVFLVSRDIPLESLHHGHVLGSWLLTTFPHFMD